MAWLCCETYGMYTANALWIWPSCTQPVITIHMILEKALLVCNIGASKDVKMITFILVCAPRGPATKWLDLSQSAVPRDSLLEFNGLDTV